MQLTQNPWLRGAAAVFAVCVAVPAIYFGYRWAATFNDVDESVTSHVGEPVYGARLGGEDPGSLISATSSVAIDLPGRDGVAKAATVVYRSTNGGTRRGTEVSGSVFVPPGDAPAGGWPVVSYGHANVGIYRPCAPSLSPTYRGLSPVVALFLRRGFAVALTDYQGLGTGSENAYLDPHTEALNMIDAVRALRLTFPGVSDRWAAFGDSQGGGASWAAAERAGRYAPELQLVGAVAVAPLADMTPLVAKASAGTLVDAQEPGYAWEVESLARSHPDLDRDDYRSALATRSWDVLTACDGTLAPERDAVLDRIGPEDLKPVSATAADRLRGYLEAVALPQRRLSAPLSIVYGATDQYAEAAWTTAAIERACTRGGSLTWQELPGATDTGVAIARQLAWVADRFAQIPVPNQCLAEGLVE